MKVEMVMPQMGESIAEATILKWLKEEGQTVEKDETILEISTDKVDSEIPAPASGVLSQIIAQEEETVAVKSIIAVIETEASAAQSAPKEEASVANNLAAPQAETQVVQATNDSDKFFTPVVKSIAKQNGISDQELESISGTGPQGRVVKNDILNYIDSKGSQPQGNTTQATQQANTQVTAPASTPAVNKSNTLSFSNNVEVVKMDKMRKLIADHMVRSKSTSPHVYTVAEVDVTEIGKWRKKVQKTFVERNGFKLSYTPFFLEAATKALVQFPYINASIEGDSILLKKNINVGCAVALGTTGLIVPVIKNADQLSMAGLAGNLSDLAARARDKKLLPDETQGGTFTITNLGTFGNIFGCPIINQPQLAILGIGAIKKRPVVVNDMIAVRDIVYLTLSYDHRIIDGSLAGQFLQYITKYLQGWDADRELY